ncbi:MAG: DegV family protein [Anaerorhabdus sp.]
MKWGIVTDSGCDLKERDFQNKGVDFTVAALKIIVDDQEFVDDDNIQISDLLEGMKNSKETLQTACPAPGDFYEGFKKSDNVLCFTLTGGLSGTYNSARMAKELMEVDDPSKKIFVCDTKSVAGSEVLMIEKSLELIQAGKSFEEITAELEIYNKELALVFTMGSYDNLIKTGRMSNFMGSVVKTLNIRLICVASPEGTVETAKKCRGHKTTYNTMVDMMKEKKDLSHATIQIHHCNNEKDSSYIREKIMAEYPNAKINIVPCKGLTTFYAMDGGILIAY